MGIALGYADAKSVAREIRGLMIEHPSVIAHPFARFSPTWLLNPGKDYPAPAYKYGKYTFDPELFDGEDGLFCGLWVEKGFGPSSVTSSEKKRLTMGKDWRWHQFGRDLAAGKLEAAISKVLSHTDNPMRIVVNTHYCGGDEREAVEFIAHSESIRLTGAEPSGGLKRAAAAKSLQELGQELAAIPDHEWVWIDFWLGMDFGLAGGRKSGCWMADKLYDNLLKPLQPWFGTSGDGSPS